jgi:hypothetical protein
VGKPIVSKAFPDRSSAFSIQHSHFLFLPWKKPLPPPWILKKSTESFINRIGVLHHGKASVQYDHRHVRRVTRIWHHWHVSLLHPMLWSVCHLAGTPVLHLGRRRHLPRSHQWRNQNISISRPHHQHDRLSHFRLSNGRPKWRKFECSERRSRSNAGRSAEVMRNCLKFPPNIYREYRWVNYSLLVFSVIFILYPFGVSIPGSIETHLPFNLWTIPSLISEKYPDLPCSSCGLTRSIVSLYHLQLQSSLSYNKGGILVIAIAIVQFLLRFPLIIWKSSTLCWLDLTQLFLSGFIVRLFLEISMNS